jgi:hypothetical protein
MFGCEAKMSHICTWSTAGSRRLRKAGPRSSAKNSQEARPPSFNQRALAAHCLPLKALRKFDTWLAPPPPSIRSGRPALGVLIKTPRKAGPRRSTQKGHWKADPRRPNQSTHEGGPRRSTQALWKAGPRCPTQRLEGQPSASC